MVASLTDPSGRHDMPVMRRQSLVEQRRKRRQSLLSRESHGTVAASTQPPVHVPVPEHGPSPVEDASAPILSAEDRYRNYEQWMKIAADNKITTNNSWKVQLIDYFHELSLVRDGDSINFRKASCTLDSCVKVYTSRVDAVATETQFLLNGLGASNESDVDEARSRKKAAADRSADSDDDVNDATNAEQSASRKQKSTLEANPENLNVKKLDLDFTVDPLFRKTCAEFDEGGASGLLHHLSIDSSGRLVMDSGTVERLVPASSGPVGILDCTALMVELDQALLTLRKRAICPSLVGFRLLDPSTSWNPAREANWQPGASSADLSILFPDDPDPEFGDPGVDGEADAGIIDITDPLDVIDWSPPSFSATTTVPISEIEEDVDQGNVVAGTMGLVDPLDLGLAQEVNEDDDETWTDGNAMGAEPVPAMAVQSVQTGQAELRLLSDVPATLFSYFDVRQAKNWAGPVHWKPVQAQPAKTRRDPHRATKKAKGTAEISFSLETAPSEDQLFATLSKDRRRGRGKPVEAEWDEQMYLKYLLPRDVHYSWEQCSRLFSKPLYQIRPWQSINPQIGDSPLRLCLDVASVDADEDQECGVTNGGWADPGSQGAFSVPELTMPPVQLRTTGPTVDTLNYDKKAKRVDVKHLKESIWQQLQTSAKVASPGQLISHTTMAVREQGFVEVIRHVRQAYEREQGAEESRAITVPFYFICLLHLANERGLEIESVDRSDLRIHGQ